MKYCNLRRIFISVDMDSNLDLVDSNLDLVDSNLDMVDSNLDMLLRKADDSTKYVLLLAWKVYIAPRIIPSIGRKHISSGAGFQPLSI